MKKKSKQKIERKARTIKHTGFGFDIINLTILLIFGVEIISSALLGWYWMTIILISLNFFYITDNQKNNKIEWRLN